MKTRGSSQVEVSKLKELFVLCSQVAMLKQLCPSPSHSFQSSTFGTETLFRKELDSRNASS